ncbi:hypothetical protein ACFQUU_14630 [Herbaspirillum sp. GCM10030257]|uniref:hypothetical protein n=1 Tax=Herbaspirillum sp. GCM10030257 TaxID=3273393 RepID=UPI0036112050
MIGVIKKNVIVKHKTSCKDVPTGLARSMPHRTTNQAIDIPKVLLEYAEYMLQMHNPKVTFFNHTIPAL